MRSVPRDLSPSPFVAKCLKKIPGDQRGFALDAPCGYGRHAVFLKEKGYKVVGIDINLDCCKFCKNMLPDSSIIMADIKCTLPIEHNSFDLVIAIHYVSSGVLDQMIHMLLPGGYLIYETFGGQGRNWEGLPTYAQIMSEVKDVELLTFRQNRVGPPPLQRISAKLFARRLF